MNVRLTILCALAVVGFASHSATAATVRWEGTATQIFSGPSAERLGEITGFFVYDTVAATFSEIQLTFTPEPGQLVVESLPAFTADAIGAFTPTTAVFVTRSLGPDYTGSLGMVFTVQPDFGSAGGLVSGTSIRRCASADCSVLRGLGVAPGENDFRSEDVSVSVVPVPAGLPLLGGGLALLGIMWRRGKKQA